VQVRFQDAAEPLPVALRQGVENRLVLFDGPVPALLRHVGHVAGPANPSRQTVVHARQRPIARGRHDALVDALIEPEVLRQLAPRVVQDHLIVQRPDLRDLLVGDSGAGEIAGQRLQRAHDGKHLVQVGRRQARGAGRREAILAAALDEFSERGFAAARLDDVARRAGVAKGTIYLYFSDKETLFQELIRAMLAPLVGALEAMGGVDMPLPALAEHMADLFVREIYETRRKDVIRLMISEGRRFPKLAEFYYREVLGRVIAAMRATLRRAADRGEAPEALVQFPQIIVAPGLVAIVWSGLFDRYEPLDVRAMMKAHIELLFAGRPQ